VLGAYVEADILGFTFVGLDGGIRSVRARVDGNALRVAPVRGHADSRDRRKETDPMMNPVQFTRRLLAACSCLAVMASRTRARSGLSCAPDQGDRPFLAGRRRRRPDAGDRRATGQAARPAGGDREQARRRRDDRQRARRPRRPDGYTLLLASQTNAISATLYTKLAYDPIEDFAPISLLGREPGVLVVNPALPVKTFAEFIAYVKERPGQIDYASSGNGSGQHLFAALLASSTGLKMNHIPTREAARRRPTSWAAR
jgi:hypothetical protein